MLRLRERAGLANPTIDHELLRMPCGATTPLGATDGVTDGLDHLSDPLVRRMREQMKHAHYDESAILPRLWIIVATSEGCY